MSRLRRIYDDQSQYYFQDLRVCHSYDKRVSPNFITYEIMHDLKSYTANRISKLYTSRGAEASAMVDNKHQRSVGEAMENKSSQPVAQASRPGRALPKVMKIWQTSFYDHIIRDQNDLYNHLDYIHYNAVKHGHVERPEDWLWSSHPAFLKKEYYEIGWGHKGVPKNIRGIQPE